MAAGGLALCQGCSCCAVDGALAGELGHRAAAPRRGGDRGCRDGEGRNDGAAIVSSAHSSLAHAELTPLIFAPQPPHDGPFARFGRYCALNCPPGVLITLILFDFVA